LQEVRVSGFTVRLLGFASATKKKMKAMLTSKTFRNSALALAAAASLSACYVVPYNQYQQYGNAAPQVGVPVITAPSAQVLMARLYPSNDTAGAFGVLPGTVTNHLNGRGEIIVTQGDETFRGEATRNAGSSTSGQANGAGNKGGYMNCTYTMNNSTQGRGACRFNNGATYNFHLGQ
jgi:hypothetical protein